jgi:hypothetical protein
MSAYYNKYVDACAVLRERHNAMTDNLKCSKADINAKCKEEIYNLLDALYNVTERRMSPKEYNEIIAEAISSRKEHKNESKVC